MTFNLIQLLSREAKGKSSTQDKADYHSKTTTVQSMEETPSQLLPEEDLGMCVEEIREHITPANKVKKNKKRKFGSDSEKSENNNTNVNKVKKNKKRKIVSDSEDPNKFFKPVKKTKIPKKQKEGSIENSKPNKKTACSTPQSQGGGVSTEFVTYYTKVKAATSVLNSHKDITQFLKIEQKRRCNKSDDRVSLHLKKEDWNELKSTLIQQLSSSKGTEKQNSKGKSDKLCQVKTKLKFWLLYPKLKGNKPQDWSEQLRNINLNKQMRRKS